MRILALDTAGFTEIAGVTDGARVVACIQGPSGRGQRRTLLSAADAALSEAGIAVRDLDGVAVSVGPGRFSGVRVGIATAKGLAVPLGLPVWGVPTLDAIAEAVQAERVAASADLDAVDWLCVMTDARRGEVYAALYRTRAGTQPRPEAGAVAIAPAAAAGWVRERASGAVLFAGSGATAYRQDLARAVGGDADIAPMPSAERLVQGLAAHTMRRDPDEVNTLGSIYIRGAV